MIQLEKNLHQIKSRDSVCNPTSGQLPHQNPINLHESVTSFTEVVNKCLGFMLLW